MMALISYLKINPQLATTNLIAAFVDSINRSLLENNSAKSTNKTRNKVCFDIQAQIPCLSIQQVSNALDYIDANSKANDNSAFILALHPEFFDSTAAFEACVVMGALLESTRESTNGTNQNTIEYSVFSLQAKVQIISIHSVIHSIELLLQHKLIKKQMQQSDHGPVTLIVVPQADQIIANTSLKPLPASIFKQSIALKDCTLTSDMQALIESTTHFSSMRVRQQWRYFCSLQHNEQKNYSEEQWKVAFINHCNYLYNKGQKLFFDWRPLTTKTLDKTVFNRFISNAIEYEMVGCDWEKVYALFQVLIGNYQYELNHDTPKQLKMKQQDVTASLQLACMEWAECNDFSKEFMYKNTIHQLEDIQYIENTYPKNVGLLISNIRKQWVGRHAQQPNQSINAIILGQFPELALTKTMK